MWRGGERGEEVQDVVKVCVTWGERKRLSGRVWHCDVTWCIVARPEGRVIVGNETTSYSYVFIR